MTMLLDDFVKKMTYRKNKKLEYKFDPKHGQLIWRGKNSSSKPVLLKQKMNFLRTRLSKKDGGDKVILPPGTCFVTINNKWFHTSFNATIKVEAPKGMTLNQCLKKCKYLIQFIAVKHWMKMKTIGSDTPTIKEYHRIHQFEDYQVDKNYFILNV